MKTPHDINLNSAECIVKTENVLSYVATNICTGQVTTVEKGTVELFVSIFGVGVLSLMTVATLAGAFFICWTVVKGLFK